jgi:hypothetical protein
MMHFFLKAYEPKKKKSKLKANKSGKIVEKKVEEMLQGV